MSRDMLRIWHKKKILQMVSAEARRVEGASEGPREHAHNRNCASGGLRQQDPFSLEIIEINVYFSSWLDSGRAKRLLYPA